MRQFMLVLAAAAAVGACGAKDKKDTTVPTAKQEGPTNEAKPQQPIKAEITPGEGDAAPPKDPIYFDFDSYVLSEVGRTDLQKLADYLNKYPKATITISGHTDERGTTEYNLALGDQRAKVAHDYLVRMGIDASRIKTISYGKERPAVKGEGEETWSKNRRDEIETKK